LLAGINLAVAMPLVLWTESMDAAFMRDREHYAPKAAAVGSPTAKSDEGSNAQTEGVSFDPCHMIVELSTQERVLISANFPAVALTEWRSLCPARWTLAGMLHAGGWVPTPSSVVAQRQVDAGLLLLIALQWFLLGAFPIKGPWKWREPGMFITLFGFCSCSGLHPSGAELCATSGDLRILDMVLLVRSGHLESSLRMEMDRSTSGNQCDLTLFTLRPWPRIGSAGIVVPQIRDCR
jgi:hypothetical protein